MVYIQNSIKMAIKLAGQYDIAIVLASLIVTMRLQERFWSQENSLEVIQNIMSILQNAKDILSVLLISIWERCVGNKTMLFIRHILMAIFHSSNMTIFALTN